VGTKSNERGCSLGTWLRVGPDGRPLGLYGDSLCECNELLGLNDALEEVIEFGVKGDLSTIGSQPSRNGSDQVAWSFFKTLFELLNDGFCSPKPNNVEISS
jgi:hypothetical protein